MSATVEDYDGLCGIIPTFANSSRQIRCTHELGHHGPCSFEKYRKQFWCRAGAICAPDPERKFIDSVISSQVSILDEDK
jgi:hypothetical protein